MCRTKWLHEKQTSVVTYSIDKVVMREEYAGVNVNYDKDVLCWYDINISVM